MPVARPNKNIIEKMRKSARKSDATIRESTVSEADARKLAAVDLERAYVNAGIAISTRVSGLNGTVLNIEYPRFDDALVQKIMHVPSFAATLEKVGFTKIIFKTDQNKMWEFQLQPPSQSDSASQEPRSTNK